MLFKYQPGDVVTLIEPDNHDNFTSGWVGGFEEYCGTQVTITKPGKANTRGYPSYYVHFDKGLRLGEWTWDEKYMIPFVVLNISEQDFDDFWEAEDVCKV